MSIVMRPTQLFTAVYLTKNLFAAKKRIYFFTYKNIILFKSDAFSLVSGVLSGSLYILIGQLSHNVRISRGTLPRQRQPDASDFSIYMSPLLLRYFKFYLKEPLHLSNLVQDRCAD